MRTDVPALADLTLQSRASVTVTLYPTATPLDLIVGTAGLTSFDLTPYLEGAHHSATEATIPLRWHSEFDGAAFPALGQMVRVAIGPYAVFTGHIDATTGIRVARDGSKSATLTVRRRDATAWWRDVRRVSGLYSVGVDIAAIARDVAGTLGLTSTEIDIPDTGVTLAHDTAQLADLSAWDALTLCLAPGLQEPLVDARGVLKTLSRDVLRPAELTIPNAQIAEITCATARAPLTVYRVKWLDPAQTRVDQQWQALTRGPVSVTVGFFQPDSNVPCWWSEDHTQRADATSMRVLQNPQAGFWGSTYSSSYTQDSQYGGMIHVHMNVGEVMAELIADIGLIIAGHYLEDIPIVGKLLGGTAQAVAIGDALMALTKICVGIYEIEGVPFDLIHAVNETEAYDADAPTWRYAFEEVENDLVPNDQVAQAYATNELIYRVRATAGATLTVADDLRLEQGDVVGIEDGRRFYVNDLSRDLTRGAAATLQLSGFFL